jgi:hypothetical protein
VTPSAGQGGPQRGGNTSDLQSAIQGSLKSALQEEAAGLRRRLLAWMAGEAEGVEMDGVEMDGLALEVLRYQARANPAYGKLLERRGVDPLRTSDWREFPPVPTRAFKELPPVSGAGEPAALFRTSGTTGGTELRGEHRVLDLELYHASLLVQARRHLLPDGEAIRVLALLPPPDLQPHSSLVHMAGVLSEAWDGGHGVFLADGEWRLERDRVGEALAQAETEGVPVLLISTAFGLVQWLDGAPDPVSLPPGSRIMETGGFKGRSRRVERGELYGKTSRTLGVPVGRIVNEYGMTELLSQFYEPVLREGGPEDPGARRLVGPPWVRTRVLDPTDLFPVPRGEPGLLCHLDLANLFSAALVLTEDLGVQKGDGFQVLGRAPGAEPRGCSLTMEDYLAAGGGGR